MPIYTPNLPGQGGETMELPARRDRTPAMKRTIDYRVLSESRIELMGLMILAVIFYHSRIDWSGAPWGAPFEFVRRSLYFSVDIFLFLSGYGLVRSRLTNPGPWRDFLYRRLMRVLPAYWLVMFAWLIVETLTAHMPGLPTLFFRFTTLGFWFGKQGPLAAEWFIPALLGLYLLFPPLFTLYERSHHKARLVAWIIVGALSIGIVPILMGRSNLLMMTTRIPAFVLGIHFGYTAFSPSATGNRSMSVQRAIFWVLLSFAILAVVFGTTTEALRWRYGLWWLPLILAIAAGEPVAGSRDRMDETRGTVARVHQAASMAPGIQRCVQPGASVAPRAALRSDTARSKA